MVNPYGSPQEDVEPAQDEPKKIRSNWPIWVAVVWVLLLFLAIPNITFRPTTPAGTYLPLKLVSTVLSLASAVVLIGWPASLRWRTITSLIAVLLLGLQYMIWASLP